MSNSRYEREYERRAIAFASTRRRTLRRRPQHAHFKRKGEIKYLATEIARKKGSRSLPIEQRVQDPIARVPSCRRMFGFIILVFDFRKD